MSLKRTETYTLDEILGALITLSHGGHPDDYIDEKTATIKLRKAPTRLEVSWEPQFVSAFEPNEP